MVVNGSRSALAGFRAGFSELLVVNVTARADVLAKRLAVRGRETEEEIAARLGRTPEALPADLRVVSVDNSGDLQSAGEAFVELLRQTVRTQSVQRSPRRDPSSQ